MTVEELHAKLVELNKGALYGGAHKPGAREFCALEFDHAVRGQPHSDSPDNLPDIRPLNDAEWSSDAVRTTHLLRVMAALWDWQAWPLATRQAWTERVTVETVRQIIATLPGLPDAERQRCRAATTPLAAAAAARAAEAEAARAAAEAARASAMAAEAAARTADAAAEAAEAARAAARAAAEATARAAAEAAEADRVLILSCDIWCEAADAARRVS
jgi:hypothetical protein